MAPPTFKPKRAPAPDGAQPSAFMPKDERASMPDEDKAPQIDPTLGLDWLTPGAETLSDAKGSLAP
ncbi:MAG: hypothetical protein C4345_10730, partial [Chloroflexota bacterium]